MAEFLVELYVARTDGGSIVECEEHARAAADALSRSGLSVRCVSSIFVPDDETCFLLYEAETAAAVQQAAAHAGLAVDRVSLVHSTGAAKD